MRVYACVYKLNLSNCKPNASLFVAYIYLERIETKLICAAYTHYLNATETISLRFSIACSHHFECAYVRVAS